MPRMTLGAQAPAQDRTPTSGLGNAEPVKLLFHEAWTRAPLAQPMRGRQRRIELVDPGQSARGIVRCVWEDRRA